MTFSRSVFTPALWLALLFLQGCSAWQVNQIANQLPTLGAGQALQQLEKIEPPQRDRAQYLLNRGTLKFYQGDLPGSREDLAAARRIMSALQATSVVENLSAVSTNETLRSYSGSPTDQVMVHVMLALTYLCSGDLDGARVEILQSQVEMQRLAKADSSSGQLPVARFLAGVIYELNREWDDALISYRQAYSILKQRGQRIPDALQDSLLLLTQRQNLNEEYATFKTEFARSVEQPVTGDGELFLLYLDGVVSTKTEARISVVAGEQAQLISIVVPTYHPSRYFANPLSVQINAERKTTQIIENIDVRARDDLSDDIAKVTVTATARAVAKYNMVNNAQNKGDVAGLIANIAAFATEQADVRSWNMLPATIQVVRARVPQGGRVLIPQRADSATEFPLQAAQQGRQVVLVLSSLNAVALSYPVAPATTATTAAATDNPTTSIDSGTPP